MQSSSAMIPVFDPAIGEQIAEIPDDGKRAVDLAVSHARTTFQGGVWHRMSAADRAKILWRVADLIEANTDDLARTEARNTGMSQAYAKNLIRAGAELFRYYAGWCTKIHGISTDLVVGGASAVSEFHAYTLMEPMGVVGLIIPWNGPFYCAAMKLAPALAAGCHCILKPAEETPLTTLKLRDILEQAGMPPGVVNIVTGYGETTGAAIASHPDIDKVAFTGSTVTGKEIVKAALGNLKRVTLELGGKSPVIIFDDADLTKAIPFAAAGIFTNAGQVCTCGSRIYVHRRVYDDVVEGLAKAARSVRLGGSQDDDATMGPLISAKQVERVAGLVGEGRDAGAVIVTGGKPADRQGFFFEPTIITNASPDVRLMREEIFGPVGAVTPFEDDDLVITDANKTEYGLAATIWTRDIGRAHRLAKRLQAGTVWLNCRMADVSMPLGGYKQSGWGHELGWKGLETYLQTKSVYAGI